MREPDVTDAEKKMAVALAGCTFVPGTATKRFAKDMAFRAEHGDEKPLTPKQTEYLQTAVIRFRRQIAPDVVALAKVGADKTANAEITGAKRPG